MNAASDPRLAHTLDMVAEAAATLRHPWWIIGSVAAVLVGLDEEVGDLDLLTSADDGCRLLALWNADPAPPSPSPVFGSDLFGRVSASPLAIEVMAGLRVRGQPMLPETRRAVPWRDRRLYVPDVPEQIAILELFGREKDVRRAERLRHLRSL